jgi:pimeloyl-ACP methyl ester carboxylesterase
VKADRERYLRSRTPYDTEKLSEKGLEWHLTVPDLAALVGEEAGGRASVYGHSSGAGLVLHTAAHGLPIAKLVLHEPPFVPDGDDERRISREYAENLKAILPEDRCGDAFELFMTTVGMPQEMVDQMRHAPTWVGLQVIARPHLPTTPRSWATSVGAARYQPTRSAA